MIFLTLELFRNALIQNIRLILMKMKSHLSNEFDEISRSWNKTPKVYINHAR